MRSEKCLRQNLWQEYPHSSLHTPHSSNDSSIKELSRVEITSIDQLSEIRDYVKPLEARRMGKLMKASLLSSLKALKLAAVCTYGGDDAVRHRMREAEVRRDEAVVHGEQTDDRLDAA